MRNVYALFAILFAPLLIAQQPAPATTLADVLRPHATTLTLNGNGALSGPGADALFRELAQSQFFLIGEDHGLAEMGKLTSALLPRAWQNGYRHYALEIGPVTSDRLISQAKNGDVMPAIEAWDRRYPWSIPFLTWREDAEAYALAAKLGGGKPDAVWGLDQEFIFASKPHLDRLAAIARSDKAKQVVASMQDSELTSERIAALDAAFGASETAEARRLIDELAASWRIYDHYKEKRYYLNNADRALLLRRHFLDRYHAAERAGEKLPKVLIRFGATHMLRGRSITGVFDLGTLLPEIAAFRGTRSYSLLVVAAGGHVNAFRPGGKESDKAEPYDPKQSLLGDIGLVLDAASKTDWTLIDLRAARPEFSKAGRLDPKLAQLLHGFDAILVIPAATPATIIE